MVERQFELLIKERSGAIATEKSAPVEEQQSIKPQVAESTMSEVNDLKYA